MRPALLLLLVALAVPAAAQTPPTPAAPPAQPVNFAVPTAAAQDVASIDAIIRTLYEVISGPVGQARALWTRLSGAGLTLQYWSEETGRWQMKTERRAP